MTPRWPGKGVGKLFDATLVSRLTASHIGLIEGAAADAGESDRRRSVPRGRSSNAFARGVFFWVFARRAPPTGVGYPSGRRQAQIEVNGTTFLLETALRQFALVHAFSADYLATHLRADRPQFHPVMAMAQIR